MKMLLMLVENGENNGMSKGKAKQKIWIFKRLFQKPHFSKK
jgi:hypothetical protein